MHDTQRLVAALTNAFNLSDDHAQAIVDANCYELEGVRIPADCEIIGHIGPVGHAVFVVTSEVAIAELRVPEHIVAAIAAS